MSEDHTTQAVVDETKVTAKPVTEGTNAPDEGESVENLLKTYDDTVTKSEPGQKPVAESDEVLAARQEVLQARDEIRKEKFTKDMGETVNDIRGDLPKDHFDDTLVRGWINARAEDDPRLSKAWMERATKPQEFKRVVAALSKEFAKKYGQLPDKQATEDRESVTAAVRGASTSAPERKPANYAGMTDQEFRDSVKKDHGFAPL